MIPLDQATALAVFVVALIFVITEKLHRSMVVFVFSSILFVLGVLTIEEAVSFVDFETLLLLGGMMVMVEVLKGLGFFHYIAVRIAKKSGSYRRFFLLMSLSAGMLSPFLDSVTVILIFSSITIALCKMIKRDPRPLLLAQVFSSNVGGNATLIGEPTNIMIATHLKLTFVDFLKVLTPVTLLTLPISIMLVYKWSHVRGGRMLPSVYELDEKSLIKDEKKLKRAIAAFLFTIFLFFIHHEIGLSAASVALLGASLMLIMTRPDIVEILSKLEWPTLIFIAGLFILVGGLVKTGITHQTAQLIEGLELGEWAMIFFVGLLSSLGSAVASNIAFVAIMIPVLDELVSVAGSRALWWALLAGANLGGNLTPMAAPPNMVVIAIGEREGYPIRFKTFLKLGIPIGLTSMMIAFGLILTMYALGLT